VAIKHGSTSLRRSRSRRELSSSLKTRGTAVSYHRAAIARERALFLRNTSRVVTFLAFGLLFNAAAVADGVPEVGGTAAVSTPPPAQFEPMTRSERFSHYLIGLGDPEAILRSAASGGIRQAENSPKEWGGGAEAYGERVGSAFAQHFIENTLRYGISSALHEDNRYFASGQSGFFRRTKYAVKGTLFARHDNGEQYFSFSRIGGAAGGAFISRLWQPRSTNSAGDAATSFGFVMAADIGFNVVREFWPDLGRHLHKGGTK
jgi:hypothetical protein